MTEKELTDIFKRIKKIVTHKKSMDDVIKDRGEQIVYLCNKKCKCHNSISCGGDSCNHTVNPKYALFGPCEDYNDLFARFIYIDDLNCGPIWYEEDIWEEVERC